MMVIELEEKNYGKTMEAITKIKEYAECLADMIEEHSMGKDSMQYRGGMGYRYPYEHKEYGKGEYDRMFKRDYKNEYRGDYGERYM